MRKNVQRPPPLARNGRRGSRGWQLPGLRVAECPLGDHFAWREDRRWPVSAPGSRCRDGGRAGPPTRRQQTRNGHRGVTPCYDHAVEQRLRRTALHASAGALSRTRHSTHYRYPIFGGSMKRVTGIGGIFFKAKDAPALQAWYKQYLGIDVQEWGGAAFTWTDGEGKPIAGTTAWSIGSAQSDHFAPSTSTFMVNYRVEDLHALVKALRAEGCNVLEKIDESEYGKFAWVIDPEGNKVELWQPLAGQ